VVDPFLAQADGLDVSVMIKDGKGVSLFENAIVLVGLRRDCRNVERIIAAKFREELLGPLPRALGMVAGHGSPRNLVIPRRH
jgi:hypothetical protein